MRFNAYSGPSGPAYGGGRDPDVKVAIGEFDRWIATTAPVDCEVTIDSDDGAVRVGFADGVPFEKAAPAGPPKKKK